MQTGKTKNTSQGTGGTCFSFASFKMYWESIYTDKCSLCCARQQEGVIVVLIVPTGLPQSVIACYLNFSFTCGETKQWTTSSGRKKDPRLKTNYVPALIVANASKHSGLTILRCVSPSFMRFYRLGTKTTPQIHPIFRTDCIRKMDDTLPVLPTIKKLNRIQDKITSRAKLPIITFHPVSLTSSN